jgi:hypothetical protein
MSVSLEERPIGLEAGKKEGGKLRSWDVGNRVKLNKLIMLIG